MNKFKVGERVRVLPSKYEPADNIYGDDWIVIAVHGRFYDLGHYVEDFMRYNVVGSRLEVVSGS